MSAATSCFNCHCLYGHDGSWACFHGHVLDDGLASSYYNGKPRDMSIVCSDLDRVVT
jgi:hypothetical protein